MCAYTGAWRRLRLRLRLINTRGSATDRDVHCPLRLECLVRMQNGDAKLPRLTGLGIWGGEMIGERVADPSSHRPQDTL